MDDINRLKSQIIPSIDIKDEHGIIIGRLPTSKKINIPWISNGLTMKMVRVQGRYADFNGIKGWMNVSDIEAIWNIVRKVTNVKSTLELGSHKGLSLATTYSALMDKGSTDFYMQSVDLFDFVPPFLEEQGDYVFPSFAENAKMVGYRDRLNLSFKSTRSFLEDCNDIYDFIFIDASHTYENCKEDIALSFSKLNSSGIICGHDYGISEFPGVTKAVHEFFDPRGLEVKKFKDSIVWYVET